jgi:hypothetical protein
MKSPVCSDSDTITITGVMKNAASHSQPGRISQ